MDKILQHSSPSIRRGQAVVTVRSMDSKACRQLKRNSCLSLWIIFMR